MSSPAASYREWCASNRVGSSRESLDAYLTPIRNEGWRSEFKLAATGTDFQARKAVAALANAHGGEVFIGIREDGQLEGTTITPEHLTEVLEQSGVPGQDWYCCDLNQYVSQTTPVELVTTGKRILVVEVHPGGLPAAVVDEGRLSLFVREHDIVRTLTGIEGIEWYRRQTRGTLLRELFYEYEQRVTSIPEWGPVSPDHFTLPRLQQARADGSVYKYLTTEDRRALIGGGAGPNPPLSGTLTRFLEIAEKVRRWKEQNYNDTMLHNTLNMERAGLLAALDSYREWLQREGILASP